MRKRQPKPPPYQQPIEIELGGKTYRGTYAIEGGMITVRSLDGSKTTHAKRNRQ
jgi:hypothetical protein